MTSPKPRRCKDCPPGSRPRPAPHPGPRCATHHRERQREIRKQAHDRHTRSRYGITGKEYDRLYEAQGGLCAICRRARGLRRKLAVDHDHELERERGSRASVRGLCCGPCNDMLAHAQDDPDVFRRAIEYLRDPPARAVLDLSA